MSICVHCKERMAPESNAARRACSKNITVFCKAISHLYQPAPDFGTTLCGLDEGDGTTEVESVNCPRCLERYSATEPVGVPPIGTALRIEPDKADALRAANEEVVQALRERRRIGKEVTSDDVQERYRLAGVRLDAAMDALDALHSPSQLPSREEMADLDDKARATFTAPPPPNVMLAEAHWADCFRWVCDHPDADLLEAAKELENRR